LHPRLIEATLLAIYWPSLARRFRTEKLPKDSKCFRRDQWKVCGFDSDGKACQKWRLTNEKGNKLPYCGIQDHQKRRPDELAWQFMKYRVFAAKRQDKRYTVNTTPRELVKRYNLRPIKASDLRVEKKRAVRKTRNLS